MSWKRHMFWNTTKTSCLYCVVNNILWVLKSLRIVKVEVFWEGHKNMMKSPFFWRHLVMSKKVDDFVIFCSLLRIYELYKTEAAIDMDIAHGSFDIFLQRDGDLAGEKCFFFWQHCRSFLSQNLYSAKIRIKVHKFWEGHKILQNLQRRFVLCSASQI